ncbi:MAG: hypothetical protein ABS75_04700 [Pelagibacterium sp. SCN 63-23]|nr:MAG: hypothetical protein ABS75_04700 [Pelagibacterium sp. SCN 63-23]
MGDIHGCLHELKALERLIVADAQDIAGEKWIVTLGDYVDRGPDSAGVIDHLLKTPPEGFSRFCLAGNHETMMFEFFRSPADSLSWLDLGGRETLASYGIDAAGTDWTNLSAARSLLDVVIPYEHIDFISSAALYLEIPGLICVHAGIRAGIPMEEQEESDLLWMRREFHDTHSPDAPLVVHGHTPAVKVVVQANRICVDTAAYATGRLTSVRLKPQPRTFLVGTASSHAAAR